MTQVLLLFQGLQLNQLNQLLHQHQYGQQLLLLQLNQQGQLDRLALVVPQVLVGQAHNND
jgi:hypothetical protein